MKEVINFFETVGWHATLSGFGIDFDGTQRSLPHFKSRRKIEEKLDSLT